MQRSAASRPPAKVPGIIDTIAAGLSVALAQPLLMAVPLLVDLYYWLGWRIVPTALTEPLRNWVIEADANGAAEAAELLENLGRSDITEVVAVFVPSMLAEVARDDLYAFGTRTTVAPAQWWVVGLAIVGLALLGTGLLMAYSVPLADAAIGRSRSVAAVGRAVVVAWARFVALLALLVGFAALVFGPLAVGAALLQLAGLNLAPLLGSLMVLGGLVALLYLYFAVDAIVVSEVGPLRAMYLSVNVVRRNFWPTLGFVVAALVISTGLPGIWGRLVDNAPGLLIGVVANAFFAGGLKMAGMIFFNDRLRQWRPEHARGAAP